MKQLEIQNITIGELESLIASTIKKEFKSFTPLPLDENSYLKRNETANKLKISLTTLNEWTKQGILKGYRIGNSIRYKSNEVEDALEEIRTIKFKRGGYNG